MIERMSRRTVLANVAAMSLAGLAGCVATSRDYEDSISETIDPDGATGLTVAGESGSIEVSGERRDTVAVDGRKRAATEDGLEEIGLDVDRGDDTIALAVDDETDDRLFSFGAGPVLDLELAVPETLRVEDVRVGSGTIDVRGVRGPLEATAGSGSIEIDGVDGALTTETGSGSQTLAAVEGSLVADGGSGSITAEIQSLEDDSAIETGSGSVAVTLPESVDATLDISTGSGDVSVRGSDVGHIETSDEVELTFGDGTHAVEIETGSGDVEVTVGA